MNQSIRIFTAAILAATILTVPVLADRILTGPEAQSLLAGRRFEFNCIDGTTGLASYERSGMAKAIFRMPNMRDTAMEESDVGHVRSSGNDLCIRWQQLNSGQEGCYRMTEHAPGRYRIATSDQARWCDLLERGTL